MFSGLPREQFADVRHGGNAITNHFDRGQNRHGQQSAWHTPQPGPENQGHKNHHRIDRKSTRLNSSHLGSSYAVFCLKKTVHETVYKADSRTALTSVRVMWPVSLG